MLPAFSRDSGFSLYRTGNFPAWSPAGDRFVVTVGSELQMFDARGGTAERFTTVARTVR